MGHIFSTHVTTWPISQLTRDPRDPWPWPMTHDYSPVTVTVSRLTLGRGKYRYDFDFILCLYTYSLLYMCTINLVHTIGLTVNLTSLKFQQNLSLLKEICAFPKLSVRLWPRCYRNCENVGLQSLYSVLKDSLNNSFDCRCWQTCYNVIWGGMVEGVKKINIFFCYLMCGPQWTAP